MKENERIIQLVKAKLEWFTYKATEEEFDPGVVEALVKLLEILDPLPEASVIEPADSLSRFMRKHKNCSYMRKRRKRRLAGLLVACAAIALMFLLGINVGVYATSKVGFFEFVSRSKNGWEFFVTGESETEYASLSDLPGHVRDSILVQDVPADLTVDKVILLETTEGFHVSVLGTVGGEGLKILIDHPAADMPSEAEYAGDINGVSVYGLQNMFYFSNGDCSYKVTAEMDEGALFGIVGGLLE